jgi:hypothetical protein
VPQVLNALALATQVYCGNVDAESVERFGLMKAKNAAVGALRAQNAKEIKTLFNEVLLPP